MSPDAMLTSPFELSHLSELLWFTNRVNGRISEWDIALFEQMDFPTLTSFSWFPGECSAVDDTLLALPLSKFPKSVTALDFGQFSCFFQPESSRLNHFLPFTNVTKLMLIHCFFEENFSVLSHGTDESDILFPKLTHLELDYQDIEGAQPWPAFGPESGHQMVQMLQMRVGMIQDFTLTMTEAYLTQHWDEEVWHALRELKREGFNLTITEDKLPILIM